MAGFFDKHLSDRQVDQIQLGRNLSSSVVEAHVPIPVTHVPLFVVAHGLKVSKM
jgi:hypothetical protein